MSNNSMSYEQVQRRQALNFILWSLLITAIALGILDIRFQTWDSVIALFGMAVFCIPLLLLNSRGYSFFSAILLNLLILLVINVNLYDGDGILDSGILAYPIFILIGTLFFGKRAAPIFTVAAFGSIAMIAYLLSFEQTISALFPRQIGGG